MKYSILLTNNNRSKSYIQNLIKNNLIPDFAIYLNPDDNLVETRMPNSSIVGTKKYNCFFNENEAVVETLKNNHIPFISINAENINSPEIIKACKKTNSTHIIYAGPGGQILKKKLLDIGKEFIHVHPGLLPDIKGSTTFYYSQLIDNNISASVIYFREGIDEGPILFKKTFEIDENIDFDFVVDCVIRTVTLIEFLQNYRSLKLEFQKEEDGNNFYIIHPVLKHLAILRQKENICNL